MRRRHQEPPEINITAFLNLMVVLIPFLLLSAAFNQIAILQLYLPVEGEAATEQVDPPKPDEDKKPKLELIIIKEGLKIIDANLGTIIDITPPKEGKYDLNELQTQLKAIKLEFPKVTQITLQSQPETPYEDLILLMDNVRSIWIEDVSGNGKAYELFPDIALGEAPSTEELQQMEEHAAQLRQYQQILMENIEDKVSPVDGAQSPNSGSSVEAATPEGS